MGCAKRLLKSYYTIKPVWECTLEHAHRSLISTIQATACVHVAYLHVLARFHFSRACLKCHSPESSAAQDCLISGQRYLQSAWSTAWEPSLPNARATRGSSPVLAVAGQHLAHGLAQSGKL
jgi:hypothetical protein